MIHEVEKVGELKRLDVRPGDRFVLTSEKVLTPEQMRHIKAAWKDYFGGGFVPEIIVLDGGLELGVIRMESGDPCPA